MADYKAATMLVTGASGQLGRAVVAGLLDAGAAKVIAGTRDPAKLTGAPVETRALDFDRPETLAAGFAGVDRVLMISTDSVVTPGQRIGQHRRAIEAAAAAGVKHVVYTSAPAPMPGKLGSVLDDHFWTEAALFAQASMTWTVLRNELYADLILMGAPHAMESGKLFSATAGRGRAYLTRQNCAEAAVAALLTSEGKAIVDVTGAVAVTQDEVAAMLAASSGRPVQHIDVPADALREGMIHGGVPASLADVLVDLDVAAAQGYHEVVTSSFEHLTGKAPSDVKEFLRAALARI